jgi:hypothetical protein
MLDILLTLPLRLTAMPLTPSLPCMLAPSLNQPTRLVLNAQPCKEGVNLKRYIVE